MGIFPKWLYQCTFIAFLFVIFLLYHFSCWISRKAPNHASEPVQCWVDPQPRFWKADNLLSWTDPPWRRSHPPTSPCRPTLSPPPYSQPSRHQQPPQQMDNRRILPQKKRRRSPRQDPGRTARQEPWRKAEERNIWTRQVLSGWHRWVSKQISLKAIIWILEGLGSLFGVMRSGYKVKYKGITTLNTSNRNPANPAIYTLTCQMRKAPCSRERRVHCMDTRGGLVPDSRFVWIGSYGMALPWWQVSTPLLSAGVWRLLLPRSLPVQLLAGRSVGPGATYDIYRKAQNWMLRLMKRNLIDNISTQCSTSCGEGVQRRRVVCPGLSCPQPQPLPTRWNTFIFKWSLGLNCFQPLFWTWICFKWSFELYSKPSRPCSSITPCGGDWLTGRCTTIIYEMSFS